MIELIKTILSLNYELRIKREMGRCYVSVHYIDRYNDRVRHKCEQIIPDDDDHLSKLEEVIKYCIKEVSRLASNHQKGE